jgi:chemotaxis protein CheC
MKSIDDLDNMHLDVLKEIGNIGAGNAVTSLSKLLNRKINMAVPKTRVLEFKEISDTLGGAELLVVGILLKVSGDFTGNIMFILKKDAASALVSMLMGEQPDESREFSEMDISALKEIGNILAGSYLSALSALTNLKLMPSVPELAIDMAGAILSVPAIEFGKVGDSVLYIETEFSDGNKKVVGDFYLVPDYNTYDVLLKALGVMG